MSLIDVIACLVLLAALPATLAFRLLNFRPLRWLGRISYGAYVLHDIPHSIYTAAALRMGLRFQVTTDIAKSLLALIGTIILVRLATAGSSVHSSP